MDNSDNCKRQIRDIIKANGLNTDLYIDYKIYELCEPQPSKTTDCTKEFERVFGSRINGHLGIVAKLCLKYKIKSIPRSYVKCVNKSAKYLPVLAPNGDFNYQPFNDSECFIKCKNYLMNESDE